MMQRYTHLEQWIVLVGTATHFANSMQNAVNLSVDIIIVGMQILDQME